MEPLRDPKRDRPINTFRPPPYLPLSREHLFLDKEHRAYNIGVIKDHLYREGKITKQDFREIITRVRSIMHNEPNHLSLTDSITVIGDIHGQYYDFVKMIDLLPPLQASKYLFLGDYVDRGEFSIECLILIYCLKISNPDRVFLLRGNHESRQLTSFFNFRTECLQKYDQEIYDLIMASFDDLPLAATINGRFLCLHGGLSPEMSGKNDIDRVMRFSEPSQQGMFCDILWSDPTVLDDGKLENSTHPNQFFVQNSVRGCSYYFGVDACNSYLKRNNLLTIIRAHEAQLEGFKCHHWNNEGFPQVVTIFSAPNYCGVYKNLAGFINFENNDMSIQQFTPSEFGQPYTLPNNLDVWSWSIPFVAEKITEIFYEVIKDTRDIADEQLTAEEELAFNKVMNSKEMKMLINPNAPISSMIQDEVLTSQLEMVLEKKRHDKDQSEQIIKGVSLHDSIIDKDIINEIESNPQDIDSPTAHNKVFSYVRGFDMHNEKRPSIS